MENRLYRTTFYDNEKDKSGGSGDFSIAKVTVTSDGDYEIPDAIAIIIDEDAIVIDGIWSGGEYETSVPIYGENGCLWTLNNEVVRPEIISGDATEVGSGVKITGDCSLAFHTVGGEE